MEKEKLVELKEKAEVKLAKAEKRLLKHSKELTEEQKNVAENNSWLELRKLGYDFRTYDKISYYKEALQDVAKLKELIKKYSAAQVDVEEKAKTVRIPALVEFLANWKVRAKEYYIGAAEAVLVLKKQMREVSKEEYRALSKQLNSYNPLVIDITQYGKINLELLEKVLDKEVDRKYFKLVKRIEKKAGQIVDVSNLRVGADGEINGIVYGNKDTVKVFTIMAGGYNIQRLHFRLLVNSLK